MKPNEIKTFERGNHCFGDILRVNEINYDDLKKEDVIDFIKNMFDKKNNVNSNNLIREVFDMCLEYLPKDICEEDDNSCSQCGNYNTYVKYKIIKE